VVDCWEVEVRQRRPQIVKARRGRRLKNLLTSILEFSILATRKSSLQKFKFYSAELNINFFTILNVKK